MFSIQKIGAMLGVVMALLAGQANAADNGWVDSASFDFGAGPNVRHGAHRRAKELGRPVVRLERASPGRLLGPVRLLVARQGLPQRTRATTRTWP